MLSWLHFRYFSSVVCIGVAVVSVCLHLFASACVRVNYGSAVRESERALIEWASLGGGLTNS